MSKTDTIKTGPRLTTTAVVLKAERKNANPTHAGFRNAVGIHRTVKCSQCPGVAMHSTADKLCGVRHRSAGDEPFVHLYQERLRGTVVVDDFSRQGKKLHPVVVNECLPHRASFYQRANCFHAFLADEEKSRERRRRTNCGAVQIPKNPKKHRKWHPMATEYGTGNWCCQLCHRRCARNKPTASNASGVVVSKLPTTRQ